MSTQPEITVHSYPPKSWLESRSSVLPPIEETLAETRDLIRKLEAVERLQKIIPFVKRALDEKYSKRAVSDPKRVACGMCLEIGLELCHLVKAVEWEALEYFEARTDYSFEAYRERRRTNDGLYNRVVSYFENEEWEDRRPKATYHPNKKFSLSSETEFPGLG